MFAPLLLTADVRKAFSENIFVANKFKGGIYILNENDYKLIKNIPPEIATANMITATKNAILFIDTMNISFLDKNSLDIIKDFSFDANPAPGLCRAFVSPDERVIYAGVIGWGREDQSGIFIVDIKNGRIIDILEKEAINKGHIWISKDGKLLFAPEWDTIGVIDLSSKKVINKIRLETSEEIEDLVGFGNDTIYAAVNSSFNPKLKPREKYASIKKIKMTDNSITTIKLPEQVFRISISQDGKSLFVLCQNLLLAIDCEKNKIVNTDPFDGDNMVLSSDGRLLYIVSGLKNQLVIWDTERRQVLHTLTIGDEPNELLVD
jgi:WD40 repeat protein